MHQFLKLPVTFYDNYGYCKLVKIKVQIRVINSDPKSVNYLYNDFRHFIKGEMRRILASQSLPPLPQILDRHKYSNPIFLTVILRGDRFHCDKLCTVLRTEREPPTADNKY